MINFYLIENKGNNILVVNNGSVYEMIGLDGRDKTALAKIYKYICKHRVVKFTTYTTDVKFLDRHAGKGLNLRFGSIEDDRGIN